MFNIFSLLFKYLFIVIIYMFIYNIIKLIYLDIKSISTLGQDANVYLKLINRREELNFKINEYYPINDEISLGRSLGNTVVIPDPYISSNHLRIFKDQDSYYVEDLQSSNGSYLNSKELIGQRVLKSGDIISLGRLEFIFIER